jgi:hypothetical protein
LKSSFYTIVCAGCMLTISLGLQAEPKVPALDPGQHPETIRYESLFPDTIVPLETNLSWKNRFLGFSATRASIATNRCRRPDRNWNPMRPIRLPPPVTTCPRGSWMRRG